jgi:hypothetical protein
MSAASYKLGFDGAAPQIVVQEAGGWLVDVRITTTAPKGDCFFVQVGIPVLLFLSGAHRACSRLWRLPRHPWCPACNTACPMRVADL